MLKYLKNNSGIAILTVMVVMGICLVMITMFFYIASSESRMAYQYGNDTRALHIAELGADLAINEWIGFINGKHDQPTPELGSTINVNDYKDRLTISKNTLELKLRSSDYYGSGSVYIRYKSFNPSTSLSNSASLIVDIEGECDGEVYPYQVKLSYTTDGNISTHKGD